MFVHVNLLMKTYVYLVLLRVWINLNDLFMQHI